MMSSPIDATKCAVSRPFHRGEAQLRSNFFISSRSLESITTDQNGTTLISPCSSINNRLNSTIDKISTSLLVTDIN